MNAPMRWILLWVVSTLLWAASDRLGIWLLHTVWLGVVVVFVVLAMVRLARGGTAPLRSWTGKAIAAALIASAAGPLTVVALHVIGQHI